MDNNTNVVDQKMQDEMVGVLTAISIVSKRLANRLSNLNEKEKVDNCTPPVESEVKV